MLKVKLQEALENVRLVFHHLREDFKGGACGAVVVTAHLVFKIIHLTQ